MCACSEDDDVAFLQTICKCPREANTVECATAEYGQALYARHVYVNIDIDVKNNQTHYKINDNNTNSNINNIITMQMSADAVGDQHTRATYPAVFANRGSKSRPSESSRWTSQKDWFSIAVVVK